MYALLYIYFVSSRRRHTRCALVTGVQTCALPICPLQLQRLGEAAGLVELDVHHVVAALEGGQRRRVVAGLVGADRHRPLDAGERGVVDGRQGLLDHLDRSEEHTSDIQSLMRISYAVFCLKKKKTTQSVSIILQALQSSMC